MRDYYDILGVPSHASQQMIDDAFRQLSRQHDLNPPRDRQSGDTSMRDIDIAHRTLSDASLRQAYDAGRSQFTVIERRSDRRLSLVVVVGASVLTSIVLWTALVHAGFAQHLMLYQPPAVTEKKAPASTISTDKSLQQDAAAQPLRTPTTSPPQTAQTKPQEDIVPMAGWRRSNGDKVRIAAHDSTGDVTVLRQPTSQTHVKATANLADSKAVNPTASNPAQHGRDIATDAADVDPVATGARNRTKRNIVLSRRAVPAKHGPAKHANNGNAARHDPPARPTWRLLTRRWSPRFRVRQLSVELWKDCLGCMWFRLVARRHDIRLHDVRVHYSDGTARAVRVPGVLRDETDTRPFRIGVRASKPVRISVDHQTDFNLRSGGWIEVWGLDGKGASPRVANWSKSGAR